MTNSTARPGIKLWIERDGRLLFSGYRAELLRQVDRTGSLARAAAAMGLSYRRAWGKLRELEEHLGIRLVTSDVGGAGGGRTRLTPEGSRLLAAWEAFSGALLAESEELFARYLAGAPGIAADRRDEEGLRQAREQLQPVADDPRGTALDQL